MNYPRILAALRSARWAVQPSTLQAIYDSLGAHLRGQLPNHLPGLPNIVDFKVSRTSPEVLESIATAAPAPGQPRPSPVAVISVHGIIGKHLSSLETMCGGCDLDEVEEDLRAAMADPNTKAILLDINSPGGTVTGVPELAAKIAEWNQQKRIYAFCDSLCASAAYWLASSCEAIAITLTADVGSIGVYMALVDDSEWWQKEGYKLVLVKAGEHKADGISGQPVSDSAIARWQGEVDAIYQMFTSAVTTGRAGVPNDVMQGQTLMGQAAVAALLADEIVPDLPTYLAAIETEHAGAASA